MSGSDNYKDNNLLNRTLYSNKDELDPNEPIDLSNCEKEPIHIPGMIQPHGILLAVLSEPPYSIVQCSANSSMFLGKETEELIGMPLADLIGQESMQELLERNLSANVTSELQYMSMKIRTEEVETHLFGIAHLSEGLIVLELEPEQEHEEQITGTDFRWIHTFFSRVKHTKSRYEASQVVAEQVKEMLGYDRVMIYEFDEQWNGKVIAEAKEADLEPFFGHHYPASDIPRQARELYLRNWLRTIVDVNYSPVPIVPTVQPLTSKPLNLSLSVLRSVSPMHIEYLQNMGVQATVTISLIHDNELWGLITCHHYSPKYVPHRIRNLCNFLGAFFSSELVQRQQLDDYQDEIKLRQAASRIVQIFIGNTSSRRVVAELDREEESLLSLMNASGAVISYQNEFLSYGDTPSPEQVRELAGWLSSQSQDYTYHSSKLSAEYPPAIKYKEIASGVLYLSMDQRHQDYIIWFRPEVIQIVDWAGDPSKAVVKEDDGYRLSPRKSFEKWREVVESTSYPWLNKELNILPELKSVVRMQTENQFRQVEEQALQNARILRENEHRYLQLMELSPVGFFTVTNGKIIYSNSKAAEQLGYESTKDLIGRDFLDHVAAASKERFSHKIGELDQDNNSLGTGKSYFNHASGDSLLLEYTLASVMHGGEPSIMVLIHQGISGSDKKEYVEMTDQLKNYLVTDSLTGLSICSVFDRELSEEWEACIETECSLALLTIDIDNFRTYNLTHGLKNGDLCLQWVADVLRVMGEREEYSASICRTSGGKFRLRLKDTTQEDAVRLAEEIRQGVEALNIPVYSSYTSFDHEWLTVSIGVAVIVPDVSVHPDTLFEQAEASLRAAKSQGKNNVTIL
ncbi:diguanylate cyclase [Neobacillus mesonae]|nr:diguanylate cyclase [Neobacillus mesonae]